MSVAFSIWLLGSEQPNEMKRGLDCFQELSNRSIPCWILCVKFTLLLPKFLQMKVTLKKSINSTYYPLFGTSLLNIYLFILESKGLVIFNFNFSEFQQLGNKYAKYILYCAFVIITQWFSIFKNFNKYFFKNPKCISIWFFHVLTKVLNVYLLCSQLVPQVPNSTLYPKCFAKNLVKLL